MKFIIAVILMVAVVTAERCAIPCNKMYKPVCGNDGNTYSNECAMRVAACNKGEAIVAVRNGECPADDGKRCVFACFAIYAPVCGSDGKLYSNDCEMKGASCTSKNPIVKVKSAKLNDDASSCQKCNIPCTREYAPVCGSDGKTHSTACMMRFAACNEKKAIVQVYGGECKE